MFKKVVIVLGVFVGLGIGLMQFGSKQIDLKRETSLNNHAPVREKVLICGVCRNIEKAMPNTVASISHLGNQFLDYRAIIYENNSTDRTRELLQTWASQDPHAILISEKLSSRKMARQMKMGFPNRIEKIARARNIVLDIAMDSQFDDYPYVIWADLDFLDPWDVDAIVETILHPKEPFDAVFAYGRYDLFALRSPEFPIGFELLGDLFWSHLHQIHERFSLNPEDPWMRVYSAFGGLGIYRRDAMRGCRYSGVVTKDLEKTTLQWLARAKWEKPLCFLPEYERLQALSGVITIQRDRCLQDRDSYPEILPVRFADGKITWFSCTAKHTLPGTCEHVPFHASMILKGKDRLFINPKIRCNP